MTELCAVCGQPLTKTTQEVCYTRTSRELTFSGDQATRYPERIIYEDDRDCIFECRYCLSPVTDEQHHILVEALSHD